MFPLSGTAFPNSNDGLADAIMGGVAAVLALPIGAVRVRVEGGIWPSIDALGLDLSGANVEPKRLRLARWELDGNRQRGVTAREFTLSGRRIGFGDGRFNVSLECHGVGFDFARDKTGQAMLVPNDALDGRVQVDAEIGDLQTMLMAAFAMAAGSYGVTIQDLQLTLVNDGPRSIVAESRITATKGATATIVIRGRVDLDINLIATLSDLTCKGATWWPTDVAAAAFVSSKLAAFKGKRVSLKAFSIGGTKLRDVKIVGGATIQVEAEFGK